MTFLQGLILKHIKENPGKPCQKIADEVGCGYNTAHRVFKENDIELPYGRERKLTKGQVKEMVDLIDNKDHPYWMLEIKYDASEITLRKWYRRYKELEESK